MGIKRAKQIKANKNISRVKPLIKSKYKAICWVKCNIATTVVEN